MSKTIQELKNKLAAAIGLDVEGANKETVEAIQLAADKVAEEKLQKEKNDNLGKTAADQIGSEMVKRTEFDAYKAKSDSFMQAAMNHIEATQTVLDSLETDIDSRVSMAMDNLLSKVTSKTETPAPHTLGDRVEGDQPETSKEYAARKGEEAKKRETERELTH